jgi:pectin methylesterase-like acyl-CoA thioesterase
MQPTRLSRTLIVCCAAMFAASYQPAVAGTLCVNPAGSHNCFSTIQTAVNHASANDLIEVEAGTYKEEVDIGIPLAIVGAGAHASIIDATGLAHGSRSLWATTNAFERGSRISTLTRAEFAAQLPLLSGAAPKLAGVHMLCVS